MRVKLPSLPPPALSLASSPNIMVTIDIIIISDAN